MLMLMDRPAHLGRININLIQLTELTLSAQKIGPL